MTADYDDGALIDAAWRNPRMAEWKPSTENRTARITIRPKATTRPSGLILPPQLRGPIDQDIGPAFLVEFVCEFGTVAGTPAYMITGSCRGTRKIVAQGYCEKHPS